MKVRVFYNHVNLINTDEEIPNLPPFQMDQQLGDDKIINILLSGIPKSWNPEMAVQGFGPVKTTTFSTS